MLKGKGRQTSSASVFCQRLQLGLSPSEVVEEVLASFFDGDQIV